MIILGKDLIKIDPPIFTPMLMEKEKFKGMSCGPSYAGYDIRLAEDFYLGPQQFHLASSIEEFNMPKDLIAFVHDKSTWARMGISVFNTVIEPGWKGHLTLEIVNNSGLPKHFESGMPIAQIIFHEIKGEAEYEGKYQNQKRGIQEAIFDGQDQS